MVALVNRCPQVGETGVHAVTPRTRERMEYSGGRRFLLTLGAGGVASVLVWFQKITSGDWAMVTIATVAAYIAGNVAQRNVEQKGATNEHIT